MASLTTDPNGHVRIGVETPDGKRRTIRLGLMPLRTAEEYRDNIAHLRANWNTPHLVAARVLEWANSLDGATYTRIAKTGLLPPREGISVSVMTLGTFLGEYFATLQVKKGTLIAYGQTRRCLLAYFGDTCDIAAVTSKDVDQYHAWLASNEFAKRKLSKATVSRRMGASRDFFNAAVRWGHIPVNPFKGVKVGSQRNEKRKYFVPRDVIQKVIDACPDAQWRLIVALARFGGVRVPSEILPIRWTDVDWERGRLTVHSPKTEHHEGQESRLVPMFPELRQYLMEVFEEAEAGTEYVITRYREDNQNLRTQLIRIIKNAGLLPWPKLYQNLRASRETELYSQYPIETACAWIGNAPEVAVTHYINDPDKDAHFRHAIGQANDARCEGKKATRNPTRGEENSGVFKGNQEPASAAKTPENTAFAGVSGGSGLGAVGFEPT
jgi:integrase